MDKNKDKPIRLTKGLGSAANYLGDASDTSYQNWDEKVEYIDIDAENEMKAAQEKASIKYNYQDFLKQFGNLTEQCTYLVETLSKGT